MNDGGAMCWRRCTEVECGLVSPSLMAERLFGLVVVFLLLLGFWGVCLVGFVFLAFS